MFFFLSKVLWYSLNPFVFALALVIVGWLVSFRRAGAGRALVGAGVVLLYVSSTGPVPQWAARQLEERVEAGAIPERVGGIVVLTGGIYIEAMRGGELADLNDTADRIIRAVVLAKLHPDAKLVITGGSGRLDQSAEWKEADYYGKLARALGVEADRIVIEKGSRNTHEAAVELSKLLPGIVQGDIVLITSAMHMPRTVGCFAHEGFRVIPMPVDYRTKNRRYWRIGPGWFLPNISNLALMYDAAREWTGLVMYRVSGYI